MEIHSTYLMCGTTTLCVVQMLCNLLSVQHLFVWLRQVEAGPLRSAEEPTARITVVTHPPFSRFQLGLMLCHWTHSDPGFLQQTLGFSVVPNLRTFELLTSTDAANHAPKSDLGTNPTCEHSPGTDLVCKSGT